MSNESGEESGGDSPANSYARAFANRGPNKRKVKPAFQSQLLQFAMLSDSEDDEDFVANSEEDDDYSTDHSLGDGGDEESGAKSSRNEDANDDNNSDDDDDDDNDDAQLSMKESNSILEKGMLPSQDESDEESEDEDFEPGSNDSEKSNYESDQGGEDSGPEQDRIKETLVESSGRVVECSRAQTTGTKQDRLVCGICLESESTEEDELVECDWCGITVHEGCYGDADESISEDKSDSDAETEPWFCDACKAKCEGYCELCPVKGGILKQTDSGKWVHLVCALYVPGVGFRDVDRLSSIVLDDISSSRWSARRCILCEDQRYSKTGVCIECDAGMCKTYFHAMCAQQNGLLTEVPAAGHLNDDDADPLFAHCKVHTDKTLIRTRIKRWTAFAAHAKNFKQVDDPDEKIRIENAFSRAQQEYKGFRSSLSPAVLQNIDEPRLLMSCPELCGKLLKKSELMGYATDSQEVAMNITAYIRACKPALSCDFVNHFFRRETLLSKYQSEERPLKQKIERNKEEQKILQEQFGKLKSDLEDSKLKRTALAGKVTKLNNALEKILGRKIPLPSTMMKPKRKSRKESETNIDSFILTCETCKGTENQHLMALCDTCHNYYHIGCLDPPLSALPKKGRKWLWQCTECDQSESSEESIDEESGPSSRKRKRKTNAPQKFTPTDETLKDKKGKVRSVGRMKKVGRKRKEVVIGESNQGRPEVEEKTIKRPKRGRKREQISLHPCCVCSEEGNKSNMVKCDECSHCYHFNCCEPKLRGNPKKTGYMWYCNDCADSEDDDDDDDDNNGELIDEDDSSVVINEIVKHKDVKNNSKYPNANGTNEVIKIE